MVFPYDFGFIPNTKGADGDPLDILVISEFQSFPGCIIPCRIIGGIKATQVEKDKKETPIRNDRFVAVPIESVLFGKVKDLKDLPQKIIDEMKAFFVNYNNIEGKVFKPLAILNSKAAKKLINHNGNGKQ